MARSSAWEQRDNVDCRAAPRSHLGVQGRFVWTINKSEEVKNEAAGGVKSWAPSANQATVLE